MNTEIKSDIIFLLGAGASIEAGVNSSEKITEILVNYGSYCPSPESTAIENLLKYIQVRIADYLQFRTSQVNFEYILGTLAELSRREKSSIVPFLGEGDLLLKKVEERISLDEVLDKLYALLRELVFIRHSVEYLYPLKDFISLSNPLDLFTLNYDLSIETAFQNLAIPHTTGYKKRDEIFPIWDPSEFEKESFDARIFKLHGSINWGHFCLFPQPPERSELTSDVMYETEKYLVNYPERVEFSPSPIKPIAHPDPTNRRDGMVGIMNFGTRKELLYASSQFTVLFNHFLDSLNQAKICIVAGYSFQDDRINKLLEEALVRRKGSLHLLVVDPSLFWIKRGNPVLDKFMQQKWATSIEEPLGKALKDGSILESAKRSLKLKDTPAFISQSFSDYESEETDKEKPDTEEILYRWKTLGTCFDLTFFWMYTLAPELRDLEQCANEADAIKLGKLLMPLNRKVRDLCYHLRWLYKAMHFGGAYGEEYLENIKVDPKPTNDFSHMDLVRKWLPKLEIVVSMAFTAYHSCTEGFKHVVTDPDYGKDSGAPSHLSVAELEIRHDIQRMYEVVCTLNDIYKGAGYEEPFEMITKDFSDRNN